MLRVSLLFLLLGGVAFFFADLEVSTAEPGVELLRMANGALHPDFSALLRFLPAILNTVTFALCGLSLAIVLGSLLAFFYDYQAVRFFSAFIRAIHEIFWAFLFLPLVGLNPICGILAIAIPYSGIFAKVYAEIRQEADPLPETNLPRGVDRCSRFLYGVVPTIYQAIKRYTAYRFECALRASAILGFIGLPTLGYHLETAFREGLYAEGAALLYGFFLLIASLRLWARPQLIWLPLLASFFLVSKAAHFSWENVARFFGTEIIPWPLRRQGVMEGTGQLAADWAGLGHWLLEIWQGEAWLGIVNTVLLSQLALVASGLMALLVFPLATAHFSQRWLRVVGHALLIILRTTPEYILAYLFLQLWGPSMLPAALALILHNGAILGYLNSRYANLLPTRLDLPRRKIDGYFFEIVPRIYGQFLAFLFYRWEVIMRESAILGIIGVTTLGFYIDSAIADDQLDKAVVLIFLAALLNLGIDVASRRIRAFLRIEGGMRSCCGGPDG